MLRPSLLQDVSLPSLPAVVVFKDGTYLTFDGEDLPWGLLTPAGGLQYGLLAAQFTFSWWDLQLRPWSFRAARR